MPMSTEVIILAAGQGSRMKSALPKVLHRLAGKPLVQHVIDRVRELGDSLIHVVVGHGADQVKAALGAAHVQFALQAEQKGTGHAVAQALDHVADDSNVLILYGDVPLTPASTMQALLELVNERQIGLLTVNLADPTGYGRIIRDQHGKVLAIVEQKDANAQQLAIHEGNSGILALPAKLLKSWLPQLKNNNAQGEYYLTDVIAMAVENGVNVAALQAGSEQEVQGVNNRLQLATLERWYQAQQAEALMLAGCTLMDPARVDVRGELAVGQDIVIDINVIFEGAVTLGDNVRIGPNCLIRNASIGAGAVIEANSVIDSATVGEACTIGPFARLRPGTELAAKAKVGNFVETKKAKIGEGSKLNHLSYVGDAEVGAGVNVGAGTITCNYDGVNKFKTLIGDGAFIGSNTALVAPVSIGAGATTAAGSTINKDVAEQQLSVARAKQRNIDGWQRPQKKD